MRSLFIVLCPLLFQRFVLVAGLIYEVVFYKLLRSQQGRFGQTLVGARNLNLLLVLKSLVHRVLGSGEILQFAVQLFLECGTDLVGAFRNDGYGLVHVADGFYQLVHIAGNRVGRCFRLFEIHIFSIFSFILAVRSVKTPEHRLALCADLFLGYFLYLLEYLVRCRTVFRFGILRNETIVFVLCIAGAFQFLVFV